MDRPLPINLNRIAQELRLSKLQIENTLGLLDAGNTVPFITRYRKEITGNLDEEKIREIQSRTAYLRQLADRKMTILRTLKAQGKLTKKLSSQIEQANTAKRLEDLYLPYKPKKLTLATTAKKNGFETLANQIWNMETAVSDLEQAASQYAQNLHRHFSIEDVLLGVGHILAERISELPEIRDILRKLLWKSGSLVTTRADIPENEGTDYQDYFDYSESLKSIPAHRVLAANRGERENVIRVRIQYDETSLFQLLLRKLDLENSQHKEFLSRIVKDALNRLLLPSLCREIRRELTESAEHHAIDVFARNVRNLLLQPPVLDKRALAIDPGFRSGCKIVALDEFGNVLDSAVVYVNSSPEKQAPSKKRISELIQKHAIQIIAIGNGTACRETEKLIAELIEEQHPDLRYCIVNEAGASVYSTSAISRQEFPDFDASLKGTISIGRRLLDPLSELVKIDPPNIGVGLYQHDLPSKLLRESLSAVVESCVNYVGVDLNTASAALLRRVSGLNQLTAQRLVDWRREHGPFRNRQQLTEVPGIGEASFQQAAGFLKISGGDNPLDQTWIHPESYPATEKLLERFDFTTDILQSKEGRDALSRKLVLISQTDIATELNVGLPTMLDILDLLKRPGRDPRNDLPSPIFKKGILRLVDLREGMELKGTVLNVVDFGAFVDIGLKDSSLVHISQFSNDYVKHSHDVVSVGSVITVWVTNIDTERRRVTLTMISPESFQKDFSQPKQKPHTSHQKQRPRKPRQSKPRTPLPPNILEGDEPARSFGELKLLWDAKRANR